MTTPRYRAARADGPDLLMNVIRAIDKTLKETRSDYGQLAPVERHAKRVDVFDSYSTNDGFDGTGRSSRSTRSGARCAAWGSTWKRCSGNTSTETTRGRIEPGTALPDLTS